MALSFDRLKKLINLESPKGLRRLLSEYIRISCLIELQKTSLLDIKLEMNRILHKYHVVPDIKDHREKKSSSGRLRSLTMKNGQLSDSILSPFTPEEIKDLSRRRARSHSAKAVNC